MIFLDNASTTRINEQALQVYVDYSNNQYYNPSALYLAGANIGQSIIKAKHQLIALLGGNKFDNIIFTSGATESNNMAINSFVKSKNKKALFGISEHPSVYNVAKKYLDDGYNIEFVKISSNGTIDLEDFKQKMTKDVDFVSIMLVNNETGAINPISQLVDIAKNVNPSVVFHSDGVQAVGKIDIDLDELGVDLFTISSHKIYGPKGIGALYVKKGININPMLLGGGQENNLRSGTENTPAIFAFVKAAEIAINNIKSNYDTIKEISDYTKMRLSQLPFDIIINSGDNCSPYIISFAVANLRAETILRMLEQERILIGNGSACSSKKRGNRILSNMGIDNKYIEGALRISFCDQTTKEEIDQFISKLSEILSKYKENTNR